MEAKATDDLFLRICGEEDAPTRVQRPEVGRIIAFSNTGKRSDGWFVLSFAQVFNAINDLYSNLSEIVGTTSNPAIYDEKMWRDIFSIYLSDDVAKTMGKVQTLPLFELLSKVIHFSNSSDLREFKTLNLGEEFLANTINALATWQESEEQSLAAKASTNIRSPKVSLLGGENRIYYGAPGTGKSHAVEQKVKSSINVRTVFHPDLQNSDFFGGLRPRMLDDSLRYEFVPGPFMVAMELALTNPAQMVFLVIEELNRAPAAAVFGDLFLLLDRKQDGKGEYDVNFPSEDCRVWFENKTGDTSGKLRLPSNLTIYATMNSADQGVFPLDTAFRRRWTQEYKKLDYASGPKGVVGFVGLGEGVKTCSWRLFVETLNECLLKQGDLGFSEDRLVGPWFVKNEELHETAVPGKVLLYLWDDLLRHGGRDLIFNEAQFGTFGQLSDAAENGGRIFSTHFLASLENAFLKAGSGDTGEG